MDIRHLRYIVAIAEFGNMTRAAEATFSSQSSLSQYVTKLEAELKCTLFTGHPVRRVHFALYD